VYICPVTAMYQRPDGIVDFDREVCIGCKACMAACPYDAIYIDPVSKSAEKCNFCAHRIEQGLEPACVIVCPERAIIVGDLNDPTSEVSQIVAREKVAVRRPEKGTNPKLFYVEASEYTMGLGEAAMPAGHAYAQQREGYPVGPGKEPNLLPQLLAESGLAGTRRRAQEPLTTAAAAIVSYDVPHRAPWDWRVSGYTWTKSLAAGAYLAVAALAWAGMPVPAGVGLGASLVALVFLALTALLLIADLAHPERFFYILLRPQWKSWLARGAFIITGYGALVTLDVVGQLTDRQTLVAMLRWPGVPLAVLTAVYTAWLFGQAKGRDLWQSPLLPLHLLVQAVLAGAAGMLILAEWLDAGPMAGILRWVLGAAVVVHLLMAAGEVAMPHGTKEAARAAAQMTRGVYRGWYWGGMALGLLSLVALAMGAPAVGSVLALVGLLAYEHSYVQAGQAVPLS